MAGSKVIENHPEILKHPEIIRVSEITDRLHGFVGRQGVEGWIRDGFDGERLQTALIGRVRVTSAQELDRFLLAINGKPSGSAVVNEIPVSNSMTTKQLTEARSKYNLPAPEESQ